MSSADDYRPRINFEITEEQKQRADKLIGQYGVRKAILQNVLNDILDLIEENGGIAIGLLMSPKIKPREILPSLHKVEEITKP